MVSMQYKMNCNLLDVISVKNCITEFIIKLYSILEKNEFHDIICWSPNNREILIKDQKALERDVLPLFFRHSKVDSFIRQLNMYGFRKVSKGYCEKSVVSFKNDNFKRGNIESLVLIKRRKRVLSNSQQQEEGNSAQDCEIQKFKDFVKTNISIIQEHLMRLRRNYPMVAADFTRALQISNILVGKDVNHQLDSFGSDLQCKNEHLFDCGGADIQIKQEDYNLYHNECSIDQYTEFPTI